MAAYPVALFKNLNDIRLSFLSSWLLAFFCICFDISDVHLSPPDFYQQVNGVSSIDCFFSFVHKYQHNVIYFFGAAGFSTSALLPTTSFIKLISCRTTIMVIEIIIYYFQQFLWQNTHFFKTNRIMISQKSIIGMDGKNFRQLFTHFLFLTEHLLSLCMSLNIHIHEKQLCWRIEVYFLTMRSLKFFKKRRRWKVAPIFSTESIDDYE
jgi:hypothetical protein